MFFKKYFSVNIKCIIIFLLVAETFSFDLSFDEWENEFNVIFDDDLEKSYREQIFLDRKAEIEEHNSNPTNTYKKALNQFSHLEGNEFIAARCKTVLPKHLIQLAATTTSSMSTTKPSTTSLPVSTIKPSTSTFMTKSSTAISSTSTTKSSTTSLPVSTTKPSTSTTMTKPSTTIPSTSTTKSSTTTINSSTSTTKSRTTSRSTSTTKSSTTTSIMPTITTIKPYIYPFGNYTAANAPNSVDFRYLMEPVQDQGGCGACWAFAIMGQIEAMLRIRNPLYSTVLGSQYLVDCDSTDSGCNGGWQTSGMNWLKSPTGGNNSAPSMANYLYTAVKGTCKTGIPKISLGINVVTEKYYGGNEEDLKAHIANFGPTVVGILATSNFMSYSSGVFYDSTCPSGTLNCSSINHAVIVIGYGTDPMYGDYWSVKNSWSANWGESGYIRMARNRNNTCNIACWSTHAS